MAAPVARYRRIDRKWDAIQYDGSNGAEVIAFVGGGDYGQEVVTDEGTNKIILSLNGTDLQSQKTDLFPMQWVLIPLRGSRAFNVVSEAEFGAVWELDPQGPKAQQPWIPVVEPLT